MQWRNRKGSSNVRNSSGGNRSSRGGTGGFGGGMGGLPGLLLGSLLGKGGGTVILLIVLFFLFSGGLNLSNLGITDSQSQTPQNQNEQQHVDQDFSDGQGDPKTMDEMRQYLSVALKDTEDTWEGIFRESGRTYQPTTLHTFEDYVQTACGGASKQVGPFYCSADETVYIDMTFYNQLKTQFGASGDFTMSYIVAHEVGHHVQHQLGILKEVNRLQQQMSKEEANRLNVRLELQADYFAGCVAKWQDEQGYLDDGDIMEAINAAQAIGDDTIQKKSQGYVVPDDFTHGSSAQRKEWYDRGYRYGDLEHGDTFSIPDSELFDY